MPKIFILMLVTMIIMIILLVIKIHPLIAFVITIWSVIIGNMIVGFIRNKKILNMLDNNCDPEAFLESIEKQRAITGKNSRINTYFDINRSAGLITMGKFSQAKDILLSIDKNKLSRRNDTLIAFTVNLMICFYELGEIKFAEELFETQIPALPPISSRIVIAVNMLVAERFFYLKRYDESREQFNKILNQKISRRTRLGILYRLGQMDEEEGNIESARGNYNQVAKEGNKLWIAMRARERCEK